jgi:hypothetical protein
LRLWHDILSPWLTRLLVVAGLAILALAAVSVRGLSRVTATDGNDKYLRVLKGAGPFDSGAEMLLDATSVTLLGLVLVVGALAFVMRSQRPGGGVDERTDRRSDAWYFRPYSKGCAAIPVAALGLFLGVGYSAAIVVGVSTTLDRGSGQVRGLATTEMLDRVAYAWGVALLPVVAIVAIVLVLRRFNAPRLTLLAARAFPPDRPLPLPESRLAAARTALRNGIWVARLKNVVARIVWTLALGGAVLAAGIIIVNNHPTWHVWLVTGAGDGDSSDRVWTQIGTWTLLGLIGLLVYLARNALKDSNVRRGVNIVWDVVSFWPHAVHPFIPTPYSMRAVGDLAQRIRDHVAGNAPSDGGRHVVVCAHSQGSLITFAAANLLGDDINGVGLLTFGSQLRVLFPRAFPMYVNHAALEDLFRRLDGSWVNLYRDTDPLAGPVLSWHHDKPSGRPAWMTIDGRAAPARRERDDCAVRYGNDWLLLDPVPRQDNEQLAPVTKLQKHSNYWTNPRWSTAIDAVRGTRPAPGPGAAGRGRPTLR